MHQLQWVFLLGIPVFGWPASYAQESLSESSIQGIDRIMETVLDEGGSPGASVAVVLDGTYRWSKAYGVADLESARPATPNTVFRIASISKMLTATATMQLVESGKIDLQEKARTYCPTFADQNAPITVHHLLSHQSGLRHWRSSSERLNQTRYTNVEATLNVVAESPLLFEPSTAEEYSAPGYNVVGCIIEAESGLSYTEYMERHIFGRLV